MRPLLSNIENWLAKGQSIAVATVIKTWGASPRPIGSKMLINQSGEMIGSVSGGCVEGAVVKAAQEVLVSQKPQLLKFGVNNESAWDVGLSCGGKIEVWLESFTGSSADAARKEIWEKIATALWQNQSIIEVTALDPDQPNKFVFSPNEATANPQKAIQLMANKAWQQRKNQIYTLDEQDYFVQVFPKKQQLIIIGAAHLTADLIQLAKWYDFETVVIDPRGTFANKTQFQVAPGHLHVEWPAEVLPKIDLDPYAYAVLLTHDPKIDDQALDLLLGSEVAYIGALGSRKTHAKRVARLAEKGYTEEKIARIFGPVGVDINAKKPSEIALSIMAQIIQVQNEHL